jgi:hypothetical protein
MESPAESAARKLTWEMGTWKSIEIQDHYDAVNEVLERGQPRTFQEVRRYIETASGQRFYDTRLSNDLKEVTTDSDYSDGARCANLFRIDKGGVAGEEQVSITRAFGIEREGWSNRPTALNYLYVGLKPLPEALPQAQYLGADKQLNRQCDRFLFTHVKGKDDPEVLVYWLDRETGVTLRVEYYDNEQARTQGRQLGIWTAESLDLVGGRHFALKSEFIQMDPRGTGPPRVAARHKITTDKVLFDQAYPKSTFWPVITKETKVFDFVTGKISGPKKRAIAKTHTQTPIQAVDGSGWGVSYSAAGMLLGLAAIAAGLTLWWRRGA